MVIVVTGGHNIFLTLDLRAVIMLISPSVIVIVIAYSTYNVQRVLQVNET